MTMRHFLLVALLCTTVLTSAKQFSYTQVHQMPRSIAKDYYIWRLLKQAKTSKKEAQKIIHEIKRVSPKLQKAYKKKTGLTLVKKKRIRHSTPLSTAQKASLKRKQAHAKNIIRSSSPFQLWLKEDAKSKIFIFNNVGKSGRKRLNHTLPKELWKNLTTHASFNASIKKIRKEHLTYLQKAFLFPSASNHALTHETLEYLAFHALSKGKPNIAAQYFVQAAAKAWEREARDRGLFWAYMASKKKRYLHEVVKSYDINLYTLLARDFLKLDYPKVLVPSLPKNKRITPESLSDPLYWTQLKKTIFSKKTNLKKLAKQYKSASSVGFYTYIMSKASRDKAQYFPMPYRGLLGKLPKTRQAIMYAIARQESRFIPASVSSSYALGMMQIMPFLVDHLAKQRKEHIDYDAMFKPKTALIYANAHMNYLTKWLQHPLYIAYAYNAGIGFTRKILRKKDFFRSSKGYEPYLSIERLPNAQAKRYGKHVLSNYVIYMNQLGIPIRMVDLLKTLHIPAKTDKFRK